MRSVRGVLKAVVLGIGVYLVWLLLPNLLYVAGVSLFPAWQQEILDYLGFFGTSLAALAVIGLAALLGRRFREATAWAPGRSTPGAHLGALGFGICTNTAVSALMMLLPLPETLVGEYAEESQQVYDPAHAALSLVSVVILAPLFEEILFRGYMFGFFREGFPFWAAAAASAALFGLAHGQLLWICYAAGMGLLFCIIRERSGTLSLSIAAHMGFNLTAVPQLLFSGIGWAFGGVLAAGIIGFFFAVLLWKNVLFRKNVSSDKFF